jgi:hypothetical protein
MKQYHWEKMNVDEIAAAICSHLHESGLECTLSGGGCVSIYTHNQYQSSDLDFVMGDYESERIDCAMKELGFVRTRTIRHFEHPDCPFWVEFPPSPLSVGSEIITKKKRVKTKYGTLVLLRPVDCVKDRLAAFYHWGDRQALDQAVMVAREKRVSMKELREWSEGEASLEKFKIFREYIKKR